MYVTSHFLLSWSLNTIGALHLLGGGGAPNLTSIFLPSFPPPPPPGELPPFLALQSFGAMSGTSLNALHELFA